MHTVYIRNWLIAGILVRFGLPFSVALSSFHRPGRLGVISLYDSPKKRLHSAMAESDGDQNADKPPNPGEEEETSQLVSGWDNPDEELSGESADPLFDEYCSVMDDFGCQAYEDLAKNIDEKVYRWIRIEAREDESLADIHTKEDVLRKIEEVRRHQETYGPSRLYMRKWDKRAAQSTTSDQVNGDGLQAVASFSALQFNALAEGLSAGPDTRTPFPIDKQKREEKDKKSKAKDHGYGGFSQVRFPEICLDFDLRRWRLLEVILGISSIEGDTDINNNIIANDGAFDLLALEEIDRFRGFFAPVLRMFGYEGIFAPKSKSPSVPLGYYSDGCALFWKTGIFELLSEEPLNFKLGNQVIILATLKHVSSGIPLLVAITHLKAQKSKTNEKIRCMQVEELLGYIHDAVKSQAENLRTEDIPVLIMGDFNADPPSEILFSDSSVKRVISNHVTSNEADEKPMRFRSAYPIDPPEDGFFTTWKTRGTDTVKRIIDYVFYSDGLTCSETLSVPTTKQLEGGKLPGLRYPSDHLMIGAKFDISPSSSSS